MADNDDLDELHGVVYEQPETEVDRHELLIEELQLSLKETMVRVHRLERLMAQLATAAIASTAAFDVLRQFMSDQTGLGGAAVFDFDTEGD